MKVRARGQDDKFVAKVLAVAPECDLALLTVEDENFWQSGIQPVDFGGLPHLQDSVAVVGYPIGGDTLSVTSGVVSRIEVTSYSHGGMELLGVQVDSAINAGNSGGPAFTEGGTCVGVAFQSLKHEDSENIGYLIPVPVIEHFIRDVERNGHYTGFPALGIEWQKMESPHMRHALSMSQGQKGVLIQRVEPTMPSASHLQKGDILLKFNGVSIANDGSVPFRHGERIGFSYLVTGMFDGENASVEILRDGSCLHRSVPLRMPRRLVPIHINERPPSYFILAGLVFTPLTVPYLRSEYGKEFEWDSPVKLLEKLMHGVRHQPDEEVVVLSQVLGNDCVIGYEEVNNTQVLKVNGQSFTNLRFASDSFVLPSTKKNKRKH